MNSTTISQNETRAATQAKKAMWLKQARQLHLYLGTFFAPSILFFALTGALQLFGLHEGHPGEAYQPPAWVAKLGALHKNQNLAVGGAGRAPGDAAERRKFPEPDDVRGRRPEKRPQSPFTLALKWFFLATSLGLVLTTVLGIYMAFKFNRSRSVTWSLLIFGTAVPAALVAMML